MSLAFLLFVSGFCIRVQAQVLVSDTLAKGDWSVSKLVDSLKNADTLVLTRGQQASDDWVEFDAKGAFERSEMEMYCERRKHADAMMVKYEWYKSGKWKLMQNTLVISLRKKELTLKPFYITNNEQVLVVTAVKVLRK